ncbi:hypothetical protein OKW43_000965 [Paraburkholderia sp. WC7.3g]
MSKTQPQANNENEGDVMPNGENYGNDWMDLTGP